MSYIFDTTEEFIDVRNRLEIAADEIRRIMKELHEISDDKIERYPEFVKQLNRIRRGFLGNANELFELVDEVMG